MIEITAFKTWWNGLLKNQVSYMGSGYDLIEKINSIVEKSEAHEKQKLIDFLTQNALKRKEGFAIIFSVLENNCNNENVNRIYDSATSMDLNDFELTYYLRVISKQGNEQHRPLLEKYFLSKDPNKNQSFAHWSLYPKFPDIFAKSYSNYLVTTNFKEWTGSAIVQAFMIQTNALNLLRTHLLLKSPKTWKLLASDLKKEVKKDIWSISQKKEVEKIITKA